MVAVLIFLLLAGLTATAYFKLPIYLQKKYPPVVVYIGDNRFLKVFCWGRIYYNKYNDPNSFLDNHSFSTNFTTNLGRAAHITRNRESDKEIVVKFLKRYSPKVYKKLAFAESTGLSNWMNGAKYDSRALFIKKAKTSEAMSQEKKQLLELLINDEEMEPEKWFQLYEQTRIK